MNKRERVYAALSHDSAAETPVGFWLHFPDAMQHGEAAVQAHLDFMEQTDTDILKVMNENILHSGETKILSTADLHKFRGFTRRDSQFQDQMAIIRAIADRSKGKYPIISTIHGLVASAFHETGFAGSYTSMGYCLPIFCREKPKEMRQVFQTLAETLMELTDCSLEAGAEGIFYAALGGERSFFSDAEFAEFVHPYEKKVYDYIKSRTKLNVLHICKSNIALERFADLRPTVVNWGVYQNDVSLTQGASIFPESVVLGGFPDRHGVLVTGTRDEIFAHAAQVLAEMKGKPFIVGSDCTLPTHIDYQRIRYAVEAVRALSSSDADSDL